MDREEDSAVTKTEEVTKLVYELATLKARAEILEMWNVVDLLSDAYTAAIVFVRLAMEEEVEEAGGESGIDEVEV